ncbi:MAG: sirohydrochlorin cobaltochelatase, partial [Sporomusaceae bacterium]|nr:sirohydrochlorin cobaltochelatase [Sporomusaceae bacterium]
LHIVGGEEYEKIKQLIWRYRHSEQQVFPILRLGRPLLHYTGLNNMPDDYGKIIADWRAQLEPKDASEAVVIMGHGGVHPGNTAYAAFQMKLAEAGLDRTFIYTVEGFPSLAYVIKKLQAAKIQKVSLKPFLLTSGDHVHEDMAGEDESSTKNQLMNAGFSVSVSFAGLGSYETIQQLYVEHVQDMIDCAAHCRLR